MDALQEWYQEIGVEAMMDTAPSSWRGFKAPLAPNSLSSPSRKTPAAKTRPVLSPSFAKQDEEMSPWLVDEAARADLWQKLRQTQTLGDLETLLRGFDECPLKATAKHTVFADGAAEAPLMVIGEAPGADEDRLGKPFVGASGQLLDRMLAAIGFSRDENVYITNILPWRPPHNRTPTLSEIVQCLPFLHRHIQLKKPKMLLLVGATAAKALFDTQQGITKLRGQWHDYQTPDDLKEDDQLTIPTLMSFHPAYLLRAPLQKRLAWRDFLALRQKLNHDATGA